MIEEMFEAVYTHGGRKWPMVDCYGFVMHARRIIFDKPIIDAESVNPGELKRITTSVDELSSKMSMRKAEPSPGAIATAWKGSLCVHVGIVVEVDGSLRVLDIDHSSGVSLNKIKRFKSRFTDVIFYDN